jgi:PAS domain S-box-containing protein
MHWQLSIFILALIVSVFVAGTISIYSWRRRQTPGATSFALLMAAIAVWCFGYALELWVTNLEAMLFWVKISYIGVVSAPVFWFTFALEYSGREQRLSRRNFVLLFIIPFITLILNWTNELHYLYYSQVGVDTGGPFIMLDISAGIWYLVSVVYTYLLMLTGTLILLLMFLRAPGPYRGQIRTVLIGAFIPWIANILYVFNLNPFPHLNLTPLALTLTGLVMGWGLFRHKLLNLAPIARDTVVESMHDGVIALDMQNRIVDINPAAKRIVGQPHANLIGRSFADFLTNRPDLIEIYGDAIEAQGQIVLGEGADRRYYDLIISPLYGRRKNVRGRLIVLHDVTERHQVEAALQTLNRQMNDELSLAYEIQQGLLPQPQPDWSEIEVICYSASASQLGGDFYRYHAWKENEHCKFAFAIGDVSGKGVSAALLMASSLAQFDATLSQSLSPMERIIHLDQAISPYTKPQGKNCALCYVELDLNGPDSATLHIVNAGGIPPYIRHKSGSVEWPKVGGFPLGHGLGTTAGYRQLTRQVSKGDLIILTSDGVAEAIDTNRAMFGFERLARTIAHGPNASAKAMMNHLKQILAEFTGPAEVHDDITIIVVQV